ncbi:hypothetical protein BP5796_06927 [Coleophoma crateriformis]|uniref:Carrier domain-containing protein n=1 Tax=Coleophoma crateriformis TaxID=565419 RepID=A0A3D8RQ84_9HELO|nr:hypothetical protein BP5796_06927 [Coleophoma crateriformis]
MDCTTSRYGRRTLLSLIDLQAEETPNQVRYSYSLTSDPSDGFHNVTSAQYANSINRAAKWLEESLGRKSTTFEPVGYIGPPDFRYHILAFAAVKAGYQVLYSSPRNSVEGHMRVINHSDCNIWALPSQKIGNVEQILARKIFKVIHVPELEEFLDETVVPVYPYERTWEQARFEPFMTLHTSGSTGLPKPIVVRHGLLTTFDSFRLLKDVDGRALQVKNWEDRAFYSAFPNFHAAGIMVNFGLPIFWGAKITYGPMNKPINTSLIESIIDNANIEALLIAPTFVEELAITPSSMEKLKKIKCIVTGSGPVSAEAGSKIWEVTRLDNVLGTTEGGLYPALQSDPDSWNYFHFHPACGFEYRPYGTGDMYEQFQVRRPELDLHQGHLVTFRGEDEVPINDLFSEHLTKKGHWLYRGRNDDIIVLSNGEKLNPLDMEASLNDHPSVRSALIVGEARFQTAVLIELKNPDISTEEKRTISESIWEAIKLANTDAPAHARVQYGFMVFTTPAKPFFRAGKGTVQREMTLDAYKEEIEQLYAAAESDTEISTLEVGSLGSTIEGLKQIVREATGSNIGIDEDFFIAGMDSLTAFSLVRKLRYALGSENISRELMANDVYNNPTIQSLAEFIFSTTESNEADEPRRTKEKNIQQMQSLIDKYTVGLPVPVPGTLPQTLENGYAVVLTGSTGSLGSYILDDLLSLEHVSHIYCLNRAVDGKEKQTENSRRRNLRTNWGDKVRFWHADLSKRQFGLSEAQYQELLQHTTQIIHNQWQVDFNLSLASFEPHIRGVRHLVDFSSQSIYKAGIFFISSIGTTLGKDWNELVPESLLTDLGSSALGYGSSKLVSELILAEASKVSKISTTICRVGQIAGPVKSIKGMWNQQEWLPTIISTSQYLGKIPESLASMDRVDWIPVDTLSTIILELASVNRLAKDVSGEFEVVPKVYHCVNPSHRPWSELLPIVSRHLPTAKSTSWEEWLAALKESAKRGEVSSNPGIKLLSFYEDADPSHKSQRESPILDTALTVAKSHLLKDVGPVTEEWMDLWMGQWGY